MSTTGLSDKMAGIAAANAANSRSSAYKDRNVVVVGIGNTSADIAVDLAGTAARVYLSHRRGALVLSRFRLGAPIELTVNYHTLQMMNYLSPTPSRASTRPSWTTSRRQAWTSHWRSIRPGA